MNKSIEDYKFSCEENLYLKVLNDYINKNKSEAPANINWNELFLIALKHETTGVLYYQLKNELDKCGVLANQKVKMFKSYADLLYKYDKRIKLLDEIDQSFNDNRIPYLIFKGIDIANLYQEPKLRSMGDTDILIHKKDENKAHNILIGLGCEVDEFGDNEWKYHRESTHIELHRRLMNDEAANTKQQKTFFKRRWKYAYSENNSMHYHLCWDYHFVYVLTHLRKHFINSGVGFRQFLDITIIAKECDLDWQWIKKELESMNMWEFAKRCFAFCERWFGIKFPIEVAEISEEFYVESTKKIFDGGVFGTEDKQNAYNLQIYENRTSSNNGLNRFKQTLSKTFPSYNVLRYSSYYSFVDNKPFLVPMAWGYRFFRIVTGKTSNIKDNIELSISNETVNERNTLLDKWML